MKPPEIFKKLREKALPTVLALTLAAGGVALAGCDKAGAAETPTGTEQANDSGTEQGTNEDTTGNKGTGGPDGTGKDVTPEVSGGLPDPDEFVQFVKNWGYSDVKYVGKVTGSNMVGTEYIYECTYADGRAVWSKIYLDENGKKKENGIIHDMEVGSVILDSQPTE
jgi:hypothetical protein